jgi:FkbM family methyltransferase
MSELANSLRLLLAHPLARNARLRTLFNIARWQIRSRLAREIVVPWVGGTRLAVRRGMTGATGNIYYGLHEFTDMAFLLHLLRPGDVFLDIGANIGSYTVLASGVCKARTVAFEPGETAGRDLERNIELNGLQDLVTLRTCALGAEDGTASFTVGRDTMNRIATDADTEVRHVPVARLDSLPVGAPLRLIKMDVEGGEAGVVRGGQATLDSADLIAVISESNDPYVVGELSRRGFRQAYYDPFRRTLTFDRPAHASHNHIFVRAEKDCLNRLREAPPVLALGQRL